MAIDYLNLVFGKGVETESFWKIVSQKCFQYYKIKTSFPPKVKPGLLLHAILWHLKLTATYTHDIQLFKTEKPFP